MKKSEPLIGITWFHIWGRKRKKFQVPFFLIFLQCHGNITCTGNILEIASYGFIFKFMKINTASV